MITRIKDKAALSILFININPRPRWTKDATMLYFPIGLSTIIGATKRSGFTYDIIDLMVEPKSEKELRECVGRKKYDVVAFGSLLHTYSIVKPLAALVKEVYPKSLVVIGNYVSTLIPEKLLAWTKADVAVIGEGEATFIEVLDRIMSGKSFEGVKGIAYKEDGRIIREEQRPPIANLDDAAFPMWEALDVESYIKSARNLKSHRFFKDLSKLRSFPIITTKGCPYRCTFCTNNAYWKYNPYRRHSTEYIVSMMKALQKKFAINYFRFGDELSFSTIEELKLLLDAITREKIDALFEVIVRVGLFKKEDEAFCRRLREAGFVIMYYSLESANQEILKKMNKRINVGQFYEQKAVLDKAGIVSGTNLIIGYPQETPETIAETFKVCYDNNIMPSIGFLLPVPGSSMYNYAIEKGFIKNEEEYIIGIGEQQFINLNMTNMSSEFLYDLTVEHLKRIRDKMGLKIPDENLICSVVLNKTGKESPSDVLSKESMGDANA